KRMVEQKRACSLSGKYDCSGLVGSTGPLPSGIMATGSSNEIARVIMPEENNSRHEETPEQKRSWAQWFERFRADYLWCLNQFDLRQRFADQMVILHDRQV